jgi:hypothetical protein
MSEKEFFAQRFCDLYLIGAHHIRSHSFTKALVSYIDYIGNYGGALIRVPGVRDTVSFLQRSGHRSDFRLYDIAIVTYFQQVIMTGEQRPLIDEESQFLSLFKMSADPFKSSSAGSADIIAKREQALRERLKAAIESETVTEDILIEAMDTCSYMKPRWLNQDAKKQIAKILPGLVYDFKTHLAEHSSSLQIKRKESFIAGHDIQRMSGATQRVINDIIYDKRSGGTGFDWKKLLVYGFLGKGVWTVPGADDAELVIKFRGNMLEGFTDPYFKAMEAFLKESPLKSLIEEVFDKRRLMKREELDYEYTVPTYITALMYYMFGIDGLLRTEADWPKVMIIINPRAIQSIEKGSKSSAPKTSSSGRNGIVDKKEYYTCIVPNIKGRSAIQIRYRVVDISSGKIRISGTTADPVSLEKIGSFALNIDQDSIEIIEYFPIGMPEIGMTPKAEKWRTNRNKGISETFLFWLVNFAQVNNIGNIHINSSWIHNYHLFEKYFADYINITNQHIPLRTIKVKGMNNVGSYDYSIMGEIEVRDLMTFVPIAYIRLKHIGNNKYRIEDFEDNRSTLARMKKEDAGYLDIRQYEAEKYADSIKQGSEVSIDEYSFIRIGTEIVGMAARPIGTVALSVSGKPRVPEAASSKLKFTLQEIVLTGSNLGLIKLPIADPSPKTDSSGLVSGMIKDMKNLSAGPAIPVTTPSTATPIHKLSPIAITAIKSAA